MADYSLYLVTDSTPAILGDKDISDVVDRAIRGGVTVVQYRDKTSDTGALIATARRLHAVTKAHGVPLLINDRVDVALAVGCEGVHLGQDDMDISTARQLLGSGKIIGITAHGRRGPHGTNTKNVIGPEGLRHTLAVLADKGYGGVPAVCIGGINASNIPQVLFRGSPPENPLGGVAVVSAIMAAADPEAESRRLLGLVRDAGERNTQPGAGTLGAGTKGELLKLVPGAIKAVHEQKPLSHNMTNLVVQNFAANVALSVGASPIMANYGEEAADLAKLGAALVINMGTVTPEGLHNYKKALRAYNAAGRPVIFDPVGAGATAVRRAAVKSILSAGYIDVIKGNESEIKTVFNTGSGTSSGDTESQRGVDSSSTLSDAAKSRLVRDLAAREQAVVVMTGKTDIVSDGARVFAVRNGHEYLGMITGTGCTLGTTVSAMVAACPSGGDRLAAVIAGILLFEIAAEQAATKGSVEGPGTFVPAFLDSLYRLRTGTAAGDLGWLSAEKVSKVE
ncbi:hypothetical protein INS49_005733 [Diaporthe citri]|uniref:uncharacterized protein n=1 Tax=Diaporthe citri TaxID=83186 RepID=UPI001C7FB44B|nr:uncharacterized protein INS49_005733 [Diaporthe citri]KAG6364135.1 hypothetical protein INS49_005733 [Diaporthe citri]